MAETAAIKGIHPSLERKSISPPGMDRVAIDTGTLRTIVGIRKHRAPCMAGRTEVLLPGTGALLITSEEGGAAQGSMDIVARRTDHLPCPGAPPQGQPYSAELFFIPEGKHAYLVEMDSDMATTAQSHHIIVERVSVALSCTVRLVTGGAGIVVGVFDGLDPQRRSRIVPSQVQLVRAGYGTVRNDPCKKEQTGYQGRQPVQKTNPGRQFWTGRSSADLNVFASINGMMDHWCPLADPRTDHSLSPVISPYTVSLALCEKKGPCPGKFTIRPV